MSFVTDFKLVTIESIAFPESASGRFVWPCRTSVPDAHAIDLNGEFYGEWSFAISTANRLGSIEIAAVITYRDENSLSATVEVAGPINTGSLPNYNSGAGPGACIRPYMAPGCFLANPCPDGGMPVNVPAIGPVAGDEHASGANRSIDEDHRPTTIATATGEETRHNVGRSAESP